MVHLYQVMYHSSGVLRAPHVKSVADFLRYSFSKDENPLNLQQVAPAQIDLFAMRFNNKLPLFVSPVPDPLATAVDTLSMLW